MSEPIFRPGQTVKMRREPRGFGGGPFEIVRVMPADASEPRYRIREIGQIAERVVEEHELTRVVLDDPRPLSPGRRPTR